MSRPFFPRWVNVSSMEARRAEVELLKGCRSVVAWTVPAVWAEQNRMLVPVAAFPPPPPPDGFNSSGSWSLGS